MGAAGEHVAATPARPFMVSAADPGRHDRVFAAAEDEGGRFDAAELGVQVCGAIASQQEA